MPSNYSDIEKALVAAAISVDGITPTGYPNVELTDSEKGGGLWIQLHNMRSESVPATLGDAGEDDHRGFLQIDINYPQHKGSGPALSKADEFSSFFVAGKALMYNSQEVRVLSSSLSSGRYVGGYYRLSLTVNYYARTARA